ncbi:MAG: hypothetical protein A7315_04065 [Candidatus Altiarchaeales archaeon WOR_SM1_79]|nr:MAG: hypothetical protein A7315_04065 [Candidatus Altiarchaeales archaeon WOR_SM1_79]
MPDNGYVYDLELDGTTIYACTAQGVYRLSDGSATWDQIGTFFCRDLLITDHEVYAASWSKLYRLAGGNWVESGPDLSKPGAYNYYQYIQALTELDEDIYAGTLGNEDHMKFGLVYELPHGTSSWQKIAGGNGIKPVRDLMVSIGTEHFAGIIIEYKYIIAATGGETLGFTLGGVYQYSVSADTWTEKSDGLSGIGTVNALAKDGINIYAGTDGGVYRARLSYGSILLSPILPDSGPWTNISEGLIDNRINSLLRSYRYDALFAGTNDGVSMFKKTSSGVEYWDNAGLTGYRVTSLLDVNGYIYAGTSDGEVFKVACIDTDGGMDPYIRGRTGDDVTFDYCIDTTNLQEYYCNVSGDVTNTSFSCQFGCSNGACNCGDTDGGINYYERGTVSSGNSDYCINNDSLREYYVKIEGNNCVVYNLFYNCPDGCEAGQGICKKTCADGIKNQHDGSWETGVDCGGPCPSQCTDCFADASFGNVNPGASWYTLDDPIIHQTALDALVEYANFQGVDLLDLVTAPDKSDKYIEAVAWYVDQHMHYMYDNHSAGWGEVAANKTIKESWNRSWNGTTCANDYCGDCEDYSILRASLLRSLGIDWRCVFSTWAPGHSYNIVNYQNKYRIMDYGPIGSYFNLPKWITTGENNVTFGPQDAEWIWNDRLANTRPWVHTCNYPGGLTVCPTAGCENQCSTINATTGNVINTFPCTNNTYYVDVCP